MPVPHFNPDTEIPDLSGKVYFITGGTAGLGRETVLQLAAHKPAHIFFSGRSQKSAESLVSETKSRFPNIPVSFIKCDLASLASVQQAAKDFLSKSNKLDVLNCNAGIMAVAAGLTTDGYENQFGTNHVGHALLIQLLLPTLEATAATTGDARIIINTSLAYKFGPGIDFKNLHTNQDRIGGAWMRYSQSKLANLLYARELAKHHPSVTSVSLHPGVSATGLVTSMGLANRMLVYVTNIGNMRAPNEVAWNQVWAATAPLGKGNREVENGIYYEPVAVKPKLDGNAADDKLAEELWNWTEKELAPWMK